MTKTIEGGHGAIDHSKVEHIGAEISHKPNVAQHTLDIIEDEDYWRKRSCAFSCLLFSLNHFGLDLDTKEIPKYADKDFNFYDFKSGIEKSYKYFTKATGWNNYAILQIAKGLGLNGKVFNKKLNTKDDFLSFMQGFEGETTFIISIDFRGEMHDKIENGSHLVTFAGFYQVNNEDYIIAKNPFSKDEDLKIYKLDEFISCMKGNILVLSNKESDEFSAFSPIYFDEDKNELVQNDDEYIRFEISNQKFVKIEKKDIFQATNLRSALTKINDNLSKDELNQAVDKLERLREYYIPYL